MKLKLRVNPDVARARIVAGGIVAIVRGDYSTQHLIDIGEVLVAAGFGAMEVTLNSPRALEHITALTSHFEKRLLIGAGTVRSAAEVDAAKAAKAQFLISPGFDPATVERAIEERILHLPGVFTASEIQLALTAGCTLLKLFPADAVGPAYLRALRGPFHDVAIVPTGGVDASNIAAWRAAGAVAVAAGSTLLSGPTQSLDDLKLRAQAMRAAWLGATHG